MKTTKQYRLARREAFDFNLVYPIGTPVLYWPHGRDTEPLIAKTRTIADVLYETAVVWLEGVEGYVTLNNIEPREDKLVVTLCGANKVDAKTAEALGKMFKAAYAQESARQLRKKAGRA